MSEIDNQIQSEETPQPVQNQQEEPQIPKVQPESENQQQEQQNISQEEPNESVLQNKLQLNHQELKKQFAPLLKKQLLPTLLKIALILSHLIITIKVLKVRQFSVILMTVIVDIYLLSQLYDKQGVQTFKKSCKKIRELLKESCQLKTLLKRAQLKKPVEQNEESFTYQYSPNNLQKNSESPNNQQCKGGKKLTIVFLTIFIILILKNNQELKFDQIRFESQKQIDQLNLLLKQKVSCSDKFSLISQTKMTQMEQKLDQLQRDLQQHHINNIYLQNKIEQQQKSMDQQQTTQKNQLGDSSQKIQDKPTRKNFAENVVDWFTQPEKNDSIPKKFKIVVKTEGHSHHQKFLKITTEKCDEKGQACQEIEKEQAELYKAKEQNFVSDKPKNSSEKLYYEELYADQSCKKGVRVQPNTKQIEVQVKRFPRLVQCEYKVEHELRSAADNFQNRGI